MKKEALVVGIGIFCLVTSCLEATKSSQPLNPPVKNPQIIKPLLASSLSPLPGYCLVTFNINFSNLKQKLAVKSVDTSAIDVIDVQITGIGITTPLTPFTNHPIGTNPTPVTAQVPAGINRIITIIGKNSITGPVPGAVLKGIFNAVLAQSQVINVDKNTTGAGLVIEHLITDGNGTDNDKIWEILSEKVNGTDLIAFIQSIPSFHPTLTDINKLLNYIKTNNGGIPLPGENINYITSPAKVTGTISGLAGGDVLKIRVNDPASELLNFSSSTVGYPNYTIDKITPTAVYPGTTTWKVTAKWFKNPSNWLCEYSIGPASRDTGVLANGATTGNMNFTAMWPIPSITSQTIGGALSNVGMKVVINGTNFHPVPVNNRLIFQGAEGGADSVLDATRLIATIPADALSGDVKLKIGTSQSNMKTVRIADGVTTVAGSGSAGDAGDGGSALSAQMNSPGKIVFDSYDNLYFADTNNNRVRKIDTDGIITHLWNGWERNWGCTFYGGVYGVGITSQDYLYVSNANGVTYRWGTGGDTDTDSNIAGGRGVPRCGCGAWNGCGGAWSCECRNNPARDTGYSVWVQRGHTKSRFNYPYGIAVTKDAQNVYVGDSNNGKLKKMYVSNPCAQVGTKCLPAYITTTIKTGLNQPRGVALNSTETAVFIAEKNNNSILKYDLGTSVLTVIAGSTTAGNTEGTGDVAQFNAPNDVAVDADDNIYVADSGNNTIRKIIKIADATPDTATNYYVATLAGDGTAGFVDNVLPLYARFDNPMYVSIDNYGDVYVSDVNNQRIRVIFKQ